MTGLDFIDQIQFRQKPANEPPVILLSGHLNEQEKHRARQAGTFAILDKPCNFNEFISLVQLGSSSLATSRFAFLHFFSIPPIILMTSYYRLKLYPNLGIYPSSVLSVSFQKTSD